MKRYADKSDVRPAHHVDDLDLRELSREELLSLKLEIEEQGAKCKAQYEDACARYTQMGEEADVDWLRRVKSARRVAAAKVHRIDARLAQIRQEEKDANRRAGRVRSEHLQYLHAFYSLARSHLKEIDTELFFKLAHEADALVEAGDRCACECEKCRLAGINRRMEAEAKTDG